MLLEFLAICVVVVLAAYRWATANFNFFKERGIPYNKPFPFVGSMGQMIFRKKSMFDLVADLYMESDFKVYGIFEQRTPLLMIRDPELVKQITIKDFDHFTNHRNVFATDDQNPHNMDNLFGSSLFFMRDARWKDMRSTLSPAFTGSKMRQMFQLMDVVAKGAVEYLKRDKIPKDGLELDMKDYSTRFSNDVIASTAFGLEVNSFKNRENTFYMMGNQLTNFTALQSFKFAVFTGASKLFKLLNLSLFDKQSTDYFVRLVLDAMKYRLEHNIVRPDMINMLLEAQGTIQSNKAKSVSVHEWSDRDIVAQCFAFFFAGFDTSAVVISFTAHELMENEDVQERLYEEVAQVDNQLEDGKLTYEALNGMKYLDQVVSEVLRKWPAASMIERECNKDITYVVDGVNIEIKKGQVVWMPISGLHRDPKYFENPKKFDPDRFSEENKDTIQPFTYFPFGMGPRNCIGSRFALMEAKAVIFYMLRDFRIAASKKTRIPVELSSTGFQLMAKDGFWLKLIPRN